MTPYNTKAKKHVIIAVADHNVGDFVYRHWLRSLFENVDVKNIDVVIADFGFTDEQRKCISEFEVTLIPCNKEAKKRGEHTSALRAEAMRSILAHNTMWDNVAMCDCGDIIFQNDISHIFKEKRESIRATIPTTFNFVNLLFLLNNMFAMEPKKWLQFLKTIAFHRSLQMGFIIGTHKQMLSLFESYAIFFGKRYRFGADQLLLNYHAATKGCNLLPVHFHVPLLDYVNKFVIKEGVFYYCDGTKISIVHNVGRTNFLRPIRNFGYGEEYNSQKKLIKVIIFIYLKISHSLYLLFSYRRKF